MHENRSRKYEQKHYPDERRFIRELVRICLSFRLEIERDGENDGQIFETSPTVNFYFILYI